MVLEKLLALAPRRTAHARRSPGALPRVCVIGAGSSGIACAKALADRGVPFDVFEKSDRVGGNWVFGNKNGMSSAYRSLHINTSKRRMAYADFPMPEAYPDFPHHSQMAAYFDAYVDRFDLRRRIRFETGVEKAERLPGGGYRITTDGGEVLGYDALAVANGHHWDPALPDPPFPGRFDGTVMHAHAYTDHKILEGKRVVVVGMGNSAMDIAVESSFVAERTILSMRRGAHVVPKYIFGRPLDTILVSPRVPFRARQRLGEALLRLAVGDMERYGLPRPDHRLGEAHPTISGRILDRLTHGAIVTRPQIAELAGDSVRFSDGSVEKADVVVYCTGYKVTFPFFDPSFVSAKENRLPLFRRVFKVGVPDLFFIGLLQPLGAIMPLAEAQSRWVAEYLTGLYALPSEPEMQADIERDEREMAARYVASRRHTMQVDFDDYLLALRKEQEAGRRRAVRREGQLPVPASAER